jgi:hypothetical protein
MKNKIILLILFITTTIKANYIITKYPPLFANVVGIREDDVLNVRVSPYYRSTKIGYLPNGARIKVYECKETNADSIWCKIGHLRGFDYRGYGYLAPDGWVNAKYLTFNNRGYVLIDNVGKCYYSFGCKSNICNVLINSYFKSVNRGKLLGVSRFNAYNLVGNVENREDICNPNSIYLNIPKNINRYRLDIFVEYINWWIDNEYYKYIFKYIHPKNGLYLSYYPNFAREYHNFTKKKLFEYIRDNKQIYWGESEGRGDKIYMSLAQFFKYFRKTTNNNNQFKIIQVTPEKFYFPDKKTVLAYEIKHKNLRNNWQNIVIFFKKYKDKYYIVGLLFNRWSI